MCILTGVSILNAVVIMSLEFTRFNSQFSVIRR